MSTSPQNVFFTDLVDVDRLRVVLGLMDRDDIVLNYSGVTIERTGSRFRMDLNYKQRLVFPITCVESSIEALELEKVQQCKSCSLWAMTSVCDDCLQRSTHRNQPPFSDNCPICIESFDIDIRSAQLSCGHWFHFRCILSLAQFCKLVDIKCPLCREVTKYPTGDMFCESELNIRYIRRRAS